MNYKKVKRVLIFPLYAWYWIKTKNANEFDYWLARKHPKLANGWYFIIPKSYRDFVINHPDIPPIIVPELKKEPSPNKMFSWHETNSTNNS